MDYYTVPLGKADVVQEAGEELTIITYGTLVHVAQAAAEHELVSMQRWSTCRTLSPLDTRTLCQSR